MGDKNEWYPNSIDKFSCRQYIINNAPNSNIYDINFKQTKMKPIEEHVPQHNKWYTFKTKGGRYLTAKYLIKDKEGFWMSLDGDDMMKTIFPCDVIEVEETNKNINKMKPIKDLIPKKQQYYIFSYGNRCGLPILARYYVFGNKRVFNVGTYPAVTEYTERQIRKEYTHFEEWTPKQKTVYYIWESFDAPFLKNTVLYKALNKTPLEDLEKRVEELLRANKTQIRMNDKDLDQEIINFKDYIDLLQRVQELERINKLDSSCGEAILYGSAKEFEKELSVEGILKEVNPAIMTEVPVNTASHKRVYALARLLIIADYVNEGWDNPKSKRGTLFCYPIIHGDRIYSRSCLNETQSPIKINPDKWDKFISIKGIDKLIKEYLA